MLLKPAVGLVVDDCHWYVKVPDPVAGIEIVNAVGFPNEHTVWFPATEFAVMLFTVMITEFEIAEQVIPFKVLITMRL